MPVYDTVEDSHGRLFLREDGYGYIAEICQPYPNPFGKRGPWPQFRRVNKGTDMSRDELMACLRKTETYQLGRRLRGEADEQ